MAIQIPTTEKGLDIVIKGYNRCHNTDYVIVSKTELENHINRKVMERVNVNKQMICDAALLALHDVFGFAEKRLQRFLQRFIERWEWIVKSSLEDYYSIELPKGEEKHRDAFLLNGRTEYYDTEKGEFREFTYDLPLLMSAQKKVDAELQQICGAHFVPWAVRYDRNGGGKQ